MVVAKKRQKRKPSSARWAGLGTLLRGPARPLVVAGLLALALFSAWAGVWHGAGVRDYVFASASYQVTPEKLQITPRPAWIHSDVCSEALGNASLDGPLWILDDDLAARVATAFSLHPWVAKVHRVSKQHPALLRVDLSYRRPVCMVEVPGGLFPVEAQGVLLPSADFSPVEAARYPRLDNVDTLPLGNVGESWGDSRVTGGAKIAEALLPVWKDWKLARITPSDSTLGTAGEYAFDLWTRGGTQIHWGRSPSTAAPSELPVQQKVARLKAYVAEYGTLEGRGGPQELDLYDLDLPRLSSLPQR